MNRIREIEAADIYKIIPLLKVLSPTTSDDTLRSRLDEMIEHGYRCIGFYEGDKLVGICGVWILYKYYVGKHIEPDNMVFFPECRGKGYGNLMMDWIFAFAREQGCIASELNCYLTNEGGQAFWENLDYRKIAYHYQRKLDI